jgi:peptide chain release factor 3
MDALQEIARRRTFAIISHPDAGKTTLTEKFLLYGGAIHLAGAVKSRKAERATASDWMELERKRGISVSSTVLQFDYRGHKVNLLDTPGHKDFSEDTYRVLTAVDGVVMVIDAGHGIETQTRKLFEVCRNRGLPIFTFMNKCDHPCRETLELMDQIERELQLETCPMNWPLGTGQDFRGVFDRGRKEVHLFERVKAGAYRAPVTVADLSDPVVKDAMEPTAYARTVEELGMLEAAGTAFDREQVLAGGMTPVYWGSALNNFGVQMLLDGFLDHAPAPGPRSAGGAPVPPAREAFSGFVFKIQANMDPRHRDRVAFLRVCSGRFRRDMLVTHAQTGKKVKLANSHKLFGQEREILEEAWPGDVIGLVGHESFRIGDTLSEDPALVYNEIPRFPPECFAFLHNPNAGRYKQFRTGVEHLLNEGLVTSFTVKGSMNPSPLLAAVGPLQFEVVQYRLSSEYGAESRLEPTPWTLCRWVPGGAAQEETFLLPSGAAVARDGAGRTVLLFPNEWALQYFEKRHPDVRLSAAPPSDPEPARS